METQIALQIVVNGLTAGAIYTLVALGLTLVFGIGRIFNFAHGEFYMLGAFVTYYGVELLHLSYWLSAILAMLLVALFGIAVEAIFFRRVRGQFHAPMIIALGLTMMISCAALVVFGREDKAIPMAVSGVINIIGITISAERVTVIIGTLILLAGLFFFLQGTKAGQALQAVAQDSEAAAVQGIDANRILSLSFAISGVLAGAAGALISPLFAINAFMGSALIFKIAAIVIIGGMGSLPGAILGGFFWGLTESFAATFMGVNAQLIAFSALVLVLLFRPRGFFGHE
jgi:branched-chain amino acid transport system permease protein